METNFFYIEIAFVMKNYDNNSAKYNLKIIKYKQLFFLKRHLC